MAREITSKHHRSCDSVLLQIADNACFCAVKSQQSVIMHTVTALKRWSCQDSQLPEISQIRAIHIYDFDNTRKS